jgi:hypothetical protein
MELVVQCTLAAKLEQSDGRCLLEQLRGACPDRYVYRRFCTERVAIARLYIL